MSEPQSVENEQAALWNGTAGQAWVALQDLLDRLFKPIEEDLAEALREAPARTVLDVGCGTGATTIAMAGALGAGGRCTGIDISAPMLELARERAARAGVDAAFIRADAQSHAFDAAAYDRIVSRFGVMFFGDPVRAFANLRDAARPNAELEMYAWRSPGENPFMTTAERAAAPFLPALPARDPEAPGQFGFADPDRVRAILEQGGWADIDIQPIDFDLTMPKTDLVRYFTQLGPIARLLPTVEDAIRARTLDAVRAAFEPFVAGEEVRFVAACWRINGRTRSVA